MQRSSSSLIVGSILIGLGALALFAGRLGFEDLVIIGTSRLDIATFPEEMSIDETGDVRTLCRHAFEVIQEQSGLVFLIIKIPEKIEDIPVSGIFLQNLNVVVGQLGICR